jgi:ferritin-like metal-binding protein YciE
MNPTLISGPCFSSSMSVVKAREIGINSPSKLLFDQLRDLYSMEKQLASSLPILADSATHPVLKELVACQSYRTYRRKVQLLVIFRCHDLSPGTDHCRVIEGLVRGGAFHVARIDDAATRDLMILAHCIRIGQYGVAGYGIASSLARRVGYVQESEALSSLREEEDQAAKHLRDLEAEIFDVTYLQDSACDCRHH